MVATGHWGEAAWRTSNYSGSQETHDCVQVTWRKSSRSGPIENSDCVEVAVGVEIVGVRDSKNASGPHLAFPASAWQTFLPGAAS